MTRPFAVFALFAAATLAGAAEPVELVPLFPPRSPAGIVEATGLRQFKFQIRSASRDDLRETTLRTLALDPEHASSPYAVPGQRGAALAILSRYSGRSEEDLATLWQKDQRRIAQGRALSPAIAALEAHIGVRNSAALRDAIERSQLVLAARQERATALATEARKFRESEAQYARLAALRDLAAPSDAEGAERARLEKAMPNHSTQDLLNFQAYMARQANLNRTLLMGCRWELLARQALLDWRRASIRPLTAEQQEADRRDRAELARLVKERLALKESIALADLVPKAKHDAFFLEWAVVETQPAPTIFTAETAALEIAAVVQPQSLNVGVDGRGGIALTGSDTLTITSPGVKEFRRAAPDLKATLRARSDGGETMFAAMGTANAIELPKSPKAFANVTLVLADGIEVDLRTLDTKSKFIRGEGAARYLFSETTDRTTNRLLLSQGKSTRPIVLSIPAALPRVAGKDMHVYRDRFLLRLDCEVSIDFAEEKTLNLDMEIRDPDGTARLVPTVRNGAGLFEDTPAFLVAIAGAKKP